MHFRVPPGGRLADFGAYCTIFWQKLLPTCFILATNRIPCHYVILHFVQDDDSTGFRFKWDTFMKWLLALHIIAVICWFAGLFYLPRLFVYHTDAKQPETIAKFKVMEHKLFYYIMNPSLLVTLITGIWLVPLYLNQPHALVGWLVVKIILVLVLIGFHISCGYYLIRFKHDKNTHSHRFYRKYNEIPTILLVLIVILAVVQPF